MVGIAATVTLLCCLLQTAWCSSRDDRVWPISGTSTTDLPQSSPYGPQWLVSSNSYDFHRGIDTPIPQSTPLYAIDNGTVRINGSDPSFSTGVIQVTHTGWEEDPNINFYATYLHISSSAVAMGDTVSKGQLIGYSGQSPSNFEHLHFEIRAGGVSQRYSCNPWRYLPGHSSTRGFKAADVSTSHELESCNVTVNVSVPADQLTLQRIDLRLKGLSVGKRKQTYTYDFCEANLEETSEDLDDPNYKDFVIITPRPFSSLSLGRGEGAEYTFEFYNLPVGYGEGYAFVYDVFGNRRRSPDFEYFCKCTRPRPTDPPSRSSREDRLWPISRSSEVDLPQSSPFGPRFQSSESRYDFHRGLDMPTPLFTPLYAIDDGVVTINGSHPNYSDGVIQITHTGWKEDPTINFYVNYIHIWNSTVAEDEEVTKGQLIGYSWRSNTSSSQFEHLHFEIRAGGDCQKHACNPWRYLPGHTPTLDRSRFSAADMSISHQPGSCSVTVNVSVPPDLLTFQRIELRLTKLSVCKTRRTYTFDVCGANFEETFTDLDQTAYQDFLLITPHPFSSRSLEREERAEYTFEFYDLAEGDGRVSARVYDVFDNSKRSSTLTYSCTTAP